MAYPQQLLIPMREDLTRYGVEEPRPPADVDRMLSPENGTVLMVVNSVCGCAAGKARPGIGMALQHAVRPDKAATVFAAGTMPLWPTFAEFFRTIRPPRPRSLCSGTASRCT